MQRTLFLLAGLVFLCGCVETGYQPAYIISQEEAEASAEFR